MRILQLIGAVLILFASPAAAKEAVSNWTVAQKSGEVQVIRNGLQPASMNLRAALLPGDIIATGANGRAMLTKGDDYVVVAPSSRLVLPKEQERSGFTRLIQQMGTMLYKVKRTGVPHFEVETPMLAAVVKGTTFSVVVDQKGAAVQVTEGVVEVSSLTGNARRLVEGGLTVYVGRERPNEIIEVKPDSLTLDGETVSGDEAVLIKGSGDVSLTTITNLTGGLVREAPVVTAVSNNLVTTPGASTAAAPAPVAQLAKPVADTAPVTTIVETALPAITEPVVQIVEATLPAITQPVVQIVDATVPAIITPVVAIVQPIVPVVTQPVADIVATVPTILCTLLCGR